jgi:hypothetical protein
MTYPVAPAPRTWSPGDFPTAARLRADPLNLAWLLTQRPLFAGSQVTAGQTIGAANIQPVSMDTETTDSWNGHTTPNAQYYPKLPGWYLSEGQVFMTGTSAAQYLAGIQSVQNSVTTSVNGQTLASNGHNPLGPAAADLMAYNPATNDNVALYAYTASGSTTVLVPGGGIPGAFFASQWCGVTSGTVVTSPQPAALWPPGSGTTITSSGGIAAGATSMTVASATGIVTGATIGLDYYEGAAVQTYAEQVTVTSVAGTTIGITATSYAHLQSAPVAVPITAAWMNQQVRDIINFLAYPPMARLSAHGSSQTLPTQTFPAGTAITFPSGAATIDNFSGWGGSGSSTWTAPVSGFYYVYGAVPITGSATWGNLSAGISVAGGTIQWGDSVMSPNAIPGTATVRKHLRLTAGQTIQLYGHQDTGSSQAVSLSVNAFPVLIVVWRGF